MGLLMLPREEISDMCFWPEYHKSDTVSLSMHWIRGWCMMSIYNIANGFHLDH